MRTNRDRKALTRAPLRRILTVVLALGLIAGIDLPGSPAGVARTQASPYRITLSVSCERVCTPGYVQGFSNVRLTGATAGFKPSLTMNVMSTLGSGKPYVIAQIRTDTAGRFNSYLRLPPQFGSRSFYIQYSIHTSPVARIIVSPASVTTTTPTPARTDALVPVILRGRIFPAVAGVVVTIRRWDKPNRRWLPYKTFTTVPGGFWAFGLQWNLGSIGYAGWAVTYQLPTSPTTRVTSRVALVYTDAVLNARVRTVTTADVPRTYRAGCPVTPGMLRRIDLNYVGFDKRMHRGHVIVRDRHVSRFIGAFGVAVSTRFPIRRMADPSGYGSDNTSMAYDNTYAFYCRTVTGNPYALSPHSYGGSIDINPIENPYRQPNGVWVPVSGRSYVKRTPARPGMFFSSTPFTKAFTSRGFEWLTPFDYQHFQI